MTLTVTGVETIEITDPNGLIDAVPPSGAPPPPLPDLTKLPKTQPTTPFIPRTAPYLRPYTTGGLFNNPILPEKPRTPWSQWMSHQSGRWRHGDPIPPEGDSHDLEELLAPWYPDSRDRAGVVDGNRDA